MLLLAGAEAFSRARVATIKALLAWIAALAGLSLLVLMLLSGRGAGALAALPFLFPLAMNWWRERHPASRQAQSQSRARPAHAGPRMSRAEALQVLGLQEGATKAEIRAAWLRLMQAAHPDRGGSDWLAAKLNQARDVLLGR